MDQSPIITLTKNNPSLSPEQSAISSAPPMPSHKFARLRPYKWWLLLITGLTVVIVVMVILLLFKPAKNMVFKPTPTPSASLTPTPTADLAQDAYFAKLSQSLVYYSFAQTSGGRNVFQADPTDTQRRNLAIGFPDSYTFLSSPNGQWLIRYNDQKVEQAPSNNPTHFSSLYQLPSAQLRVTSAIFSADSNLLALDITQNSQSPADSQQPYYTNQLLTIPVTSNSAKRTATSIINTDKLFRYKLVGFPDNKTVWYMEDREGRLSNLSQLTILPAQATKVLSVYNSQLTTMQFTSDMHYAYSLSSTYITQSDLTNQQAHIIYSLDTSCPKTTQSNASTLSGLTISPINQLLLTIAFKPCANQPRPTQGDTPLPTQRTILLNTLTGQVSQQQDNQPIPSFSQSAWSPDGQHVWLTIDQSTHYELDIEQLQVHAIPSLDRQTITKEKLYFMAWLSPFNPQTP
jgi:hypothetical protein